VNDFFLRFVPGANEKSDKYKVRVSRLMTLFKMACGLFATTFVSSIEGVWTFIMECGAGIGLVLILRWYWWRINAWSEIAATITPFVVYGILFGIRKAEEASMTLIPEGSTAQSMVMAEHPYLYFPYSFFIILGSCTLVWLTVTYLTKPVEAGHLESF